MLEVYDLHKVYGKRQVAVQCVTLQVPKGTIFGLLGPNGAGKTTIIKILTTLTKPDSGRCLINGLDVLKDPLAVKKIIAVVPQENNLERELTVYENLYIYGLLHGVDNIRAKIQNKLQLLGLPSDTLAGRLSGGMQRRLLIARALLTEPEVLFLDEPSIGLDPQIRRQLWDVIRKTKIEGRTVVLTTHYIEEAEALCDSIGILSQGKLVALDSPANLKKLIGEYVVEVIAEDGSSRQYFFDSILKAHEQARMLQNTVVIRKSNLEDVFLHLTGQRLQ